MKLESNTLRPELEDAPAKLLLLESSRYNSLRLHVQSSRFSDRRASVCRSLGKKCRGGGNLSRGPRFCRGDRKSTRLNSSHLVISYAVFCLKKKKKKQIIFYLKKKKQKNRINKIKT